MDGTHVAWNLAHGMYAATVVTFVNSILSISVKITPPGFAVHKAPLFPWLKFA